MERTASAIEARLEQWCIANFIHLEKLGERYYTVSDFGKLFLVLPKKDGKLISKEMTIITDEQEMSILTNSTDDEINYVLFEFGGEFYYCKKLFVKDEYNEPQLQASFNDFKYAGKATVQLPSIANVGIHTEYEMLNGSGLKTYIKKAKFLGDCKYIGLCDKNTLAGTMAFQLEAEKQGLHSIIGATFDIVRDYDLTQEVQTTFEVKLYVTNQQGWQNLMQINKLFNIDFNHFVPEHNLLQYGAGLICVFNSSSHLNFDNRHDLEKRTKPYYKAFEAVYFQFDPVNFYDDLVDMQHLQYLNKYLKFRQQAAEVVLEPIIIQDCYYVDPEHYVVKDYLNKVSGKAQDYSEDQYFKPFEQLAAQIRALFPQNSKGNAAYEQLMKVGLGSLEKLCQACAGFKIETGVRHLPAYENQEENMTNEELFLSICTEGMERKIVAKEKDLETYMQRFEIEYEVIKGADLIDYFLILWDIVNWCKHSNIYVGPGRGSVGGSIIAYLMDITDIDPIEHSLLFERFLNQARLMPEEIYEIELDNGNCIKVRKDNKVKLTDGTFVLAKDLIEQHDVDFDFLLSNYGNK